MKIRHSQVSKIPKELKERGKIVQAVTMKVKRRHRKRRRLREISNSRWKNSKLIRDKKNLKSKNSVSSLCAEK
jgi:hypothetical protein